MPVENSRRRGLTWLLLPAALAVVAVLSLTWRSPVPATDLWSGDGAKSEAARAIFLDLRMNRLLAGILVGAALAVSGAALQSLFRNPLAEPYLLGISSGGALGAMTAVACRLPDIGAFGSANVLAFGGASAAAWAVYYIGMTPSGSFRGSFDRAGLLLIGLALSAFLTAVMSLVVYLSNRPELAQQVTFWLMGGLADVSSSQNVVLATAVAIGLLLLISSSRDLNALQVGDDEARSLGVALPAVHMRLLLASSLMSAAAVAAAGLIGFVGLLAPHLVRLSMSSDARVLLPAAALAGAVVLTASDMIARSAAYPVEIPVGIVTALLGVPLFLWLARRL